MFVFLNYMKSWVKPQPHNFDINKIFLLLTNTDLIWSKIQSNNILKYYNLNNKKFNLNKS